MARLKNTNYLQIIDSHIQLAKPYEVAQLGFTTSIFRLVTIDINAA